MLFLILLSTVPTILCMDAVTKDLVTPAKQFGERCGYDSCKEIREDTLNIHIVPHTHGELGFTSNFYVHYTGNFAPDQPKSQVNMKRILDYTITELWADTERKFTLSDMAYFFYWWSQRDVTVHRMVYELIRQGRLHIVGGGFSMPDEATTSYHAIIDMLTYSLKKLNSTFLDCARPLVSWQADVFGHSREFASLMAQMGFDGHFINPISYDDEVGRMVSKSLEFLWRGNDDLGAHSDVFTHKLFDGYWSPPGFCFGTFCEDPLLVDSDSLFKNIEGRVDAFIDAAVHRQGPYYTTKNIMVVMGQRFGYFDAGVWFANIDKLISNVNDRSSKKGFPVYAFYSAPACYLKAVMEANPALTVKQDDFLPFAYDQTSMAVGFFTSRPTLKYLARQGHVYLQIAKQLQVTARVLGGFDAIMERLMWVNSVFQDHNILTGVLTELGRRYYTHKMHSAIQSSTALINKAFNKLRHSPENTRYHRCSFNISLCQNTDAQQYFIVIYNPLAWNVTVNVRLPSLNEPFTVYHHSGLRVKAAMMKIPEPVFNIYRHKTYARHELVFIAEDIPALGFRSYFIRLRSYGWNRKKRTAKRAILKRVNKHKTKKYLVRQAFPNSAAEEKDDVSFDYDYFEGTSTTPKTKILFGSVKTDRDFEQMGYKTDVITPRSRADEHSQRKTDVNATFIDEEVRPMKNMNDDLVANNNTVDKPEENKETTTKQEDVLESSAEITVNETSDSDSNIALFNDSDFMETTTYSVTTYETTTLKYESTTDDSYKIIKWSELESNVSKEFIKEDKGNVANRVGKEESKSDKETNKDVIEEIDDDKLDAKMKENEIESAKVSKEEQKSRKFSEKDDEFNKNNIKNTTLTVKTTPVVETTTSVSSIEEQLNMIKDKGSGATPIKAETTTSFTVASSVEEEINMNENKGNEEITESRKSGKHASEDERTQQFQTPNAIPVDSMERYKTTDKMWQGYDYYEADDFYIKNKYIRIKLDSMRRINNITLSNGLNITFNIDMYYYASDDPKKFSKDDRQPGITMFRAMDPRPVLINEQVRVRIYKNRLVEEVHYQFSSYASFVIRLYRRDPVIEVEWLVGPVPIGDDIGKDMFIRYTTNLEHRGVFYTDSNGRQTIKRIRHRRPTYEPISFDYLAGNIYPVTSRIYIEDEDMNVRFSVFNDRAQGATSLADGEIDMFLHRRILTDDTNRGILILNETEYGQGIRVRGKHFIYVTKAYSKPNRIFEKKLAKEIELAPQILVTKSGPYGINSRNIWRQHCNEFTALKTKLPIGVHILTLEKWGEKGEDLLLRLENYLEKSDTIKSGVKRVVLKDLFVNINIKHVYETSLGANMWLDQNKKWQWRKKQKFFKSFNNAYGSKIREFADNTEEVLEKVVGDAITLAPQQIRTFFVTYDYVAQT